MRGCWTMRGARGAAIRGLVVLVAMAGCGDDGGGGGGFGDPCRVTDLTGRSTCGGELICLLSGETGDGTCVECLFDDDCGGAGATCDSLGRCDGPGLGDDDDDMMACVRDTDCPGVQRCEEGVCRERMMMMDTLGQRYLEAVNTRVELACDCFVVLDFPSRAACIEEIGLTERESMCAEDAVDANPGVATTIECFRRAELAFSTCLMEEGCEGAFPCEFDRLADLDECPAASPGDAEAYDAAIDECFRTDELCSNTCAFAGDGECDDGGPGSDFDVCDLGTDCEDCGPR